MRPAEARPISPLASEPNLADEMASLTAEELTTAILAAPSTDALAARSDAELADLLVENFLADEPAPSPRFFLLQAIVERLRSLIPAAASGIVPVRDEARDLEGRISVAETVADMTARGFERHIEMLRRTLAERDELLAAATSFRFGGWVATKLLYGSYWQVADAMGLNVAPVCLGRDMAIDLAKELAAKGGGR